MLKDVLDCKRKLDEFYEEVLKAVVEDYPKFANDVQLGEVYKLTPISATLKMQITVSGEELQVTAMFSKETEERGQIVAIYVDGFGKISVTEWRKCLPMNFSAKSVDQ